MNSEGAITKEEYNALPVSEKKRYLIKMIRICNSDIGKQLLYIETAPDLIQIEAAKRKIVIVSGYLMENAMKLEKVGFQNEIKDQSPVNDPSKSELIQTITMCNKCKFPVHYMYQRTAIGKIHAYSNNKANFATCRCIDPIPMEWEIKNGIAIQPKETKETDLVNESPVLEDPDLFDDSKINASQYNFVSCAKCKRIVGYLHHQLALDIKNIRRINQPKWAVCKCINPQLYITNPSHIPDVQSPTSEAFSDDMNEGPRTQLNEKELDNPDETDRYSVSYIGNGEYGVIDKKAPKVMIDEKLKGHVLLRTKNGSQPAQIACDAMNKVDKKKVNPFTGKEIDTSKEAIKNLINECLNEREAVRVAKLDLVGRNDSPNKLDDKWKNY
jgi:hypothetical protein